MGPCMCGDPYCSSCGNPSAMAEADAEIARTEYAIEKFMPVTDFNGIAVCDCGQELCGGYPIPFLIIPGCCSKCFLRDHPELQDPDPDPFEYEELFDGVGL